jgi:hypothetical protein
MKKSMFLVFSLLMLGVLFSVNAPQALATVRYQQGMTITTDCSGYSFSVTSPTAPRFVKVYGGDLGTKYLWGQFGTATTGLMRGYFVPNGVRSTTAYIAGKDYFCI